MRRLPFEGEGGMGGDGLFRWGEEGCEAKNGREDDRFGTR